MADYLMEFWALYTFDIMAIGCAFSLGALVGYATRRSPRPVMMPTRDAKGRFRPWKELA
jgi:hypothetical protein